MSTVTEDRTDERIAAFVDAQPVIELPPFETWPTTAPWHKRPHTTIADEADRLDRLFPGWYKRIDPETLDMPEPDCCVLAQGAPHLMYGDSRHMVDQDAAMRNEHPCVGAYVSPLVKPEWLAEVDKRLHPPTAKRSSVLHRLATFLF